jgi:hypothetical protein
VLSGLSRTRSGEVQTSGRSPSPRCRRSQHHEGATPFTTELSLLPLLRRPMHCSSLLSASVSLRTRTGLDMTRVARPQLSSGGREGCGSGH